MIIKTDFLKNESPQPEALKPGWYEVEVKGAEQHTSQNEKPYLGIQLIVQGPDRQGTTLWDELYLTEKAAWRLRAFLYGLGVEAKDGVDTDELIGKRLLVKVRTNDGEFGSRRFQIAGYKPIKEEQTN